jgi:hypothetical protein
LNGIFHNLAVLCLKNKEDVAREQVNWTFLLCTMCFPNTILFNPYIWSVLPHLPMEKLKLSEVEYVAKDCTAMVKHLYQCAASQVEISQICPQVYMCVCVFAEV